MNLLLDTHIALWAVEQNQRLSARARAIVLDVANVSHVSVVSLWEIGIKHALVRNGERLIDISARRAAEMFENAGFTLLPVSASHAGAVDDLPPIHTDPFDRLLVAQALAEPLRLLTHDAKVAAYSDTVILA